MTKDSYTVLGNIKIETFDGTGSFVHFRQVSSVMQLILLRQGREIFLYLTRVQYNGYILENVLHIFEIIKLKWKPTKNFSGPILFKSNNGPCTVD